jgi:opacity protein-like surface antigen
LTDADVTEPGVTAELESDTDVAVGIAIGHAYSNNIRAEIEFAYQKNHADTYNKSSVKSDATGYTSSYAGLLNCYYDFINDSSFIPFITAGIGYAKVKLDDFNYSGSGAPNIDDDDAVFAYQVVVGVGYAVSEIFIKAAFLPSAWHRSTRYGLIEGGLQVCGQSGPHVLQGDRLSK